MPNIVHFVKSAKEDNPAVKQGQPYFWMKPKGEEKKFSKLPFKPSEIETDPFKKLWYATQERITNLRFEYENSMAPNTDPDNCAMVIGLLVMTTLDDISNCIGIVRNSYLNIPEHLRRYPQGVRLRKWLDDAVEWRERIEDIDIKGVDRCNFMGQLRRLDEANPGKIQ